VGVRKNLWEQPGYVFNTVINLSQRNTGSAATGNVSLPRPAIPLFNYCGGFSSTPSDWQTGCTFFK
jgi:hypothetical protein